MMLTIKALSGGSVQLEVEPNDSVRLSSFLPLSYPLPPTISLVQ